MINNEISFLVSSLLYNTDCAHRYAVSEEKLKAYTEKAGTYVYVVSTKCDIHRAKILL
jgi:hypothetical protein